MSKALLLSVIAAAAAAACGGNGTGPLSMSEARDVCADLCGHDEKCGSLDMGETVASCTTECAADLGGGAYRGDVLVDAAACISSQTCGADDSECVQCSPTSAHEAFETRCRAKATECGATTPADIDPICETTWMPDSEVGYVCIFTPAVMDALRACFDKTCEQIGDCFDEVGARYNVDF